MVCVFYFSTFFVFLCVMFCSLVKIMELGTNLEQNLVPPQAIFVVFRFYLIDSWCKNRLFSTANWPQNLKKIRPPSAAEKTLKKNKKTQIFYFLAFLEIFYFFSEMREGDGGVCWPHHQFSPPLYKHPVFCWVLWHRPGVLQSGGKRSDGGPRTVPFQFNTSQYWKESATLNPINRSPLWYKIMTF